GNLVLARALPERAAVVELTNRVLAGLDLFRRRADLRPRHDLRWLTRHAAAHPCARRALPQARLASACDPHWCRRNVDVRRRDGVLLRPRHDGPVWREDRRRRHSIHRDRRRTTGERLGGPPRPAALQRRDRARTDRDGLRAVPRTAYPAEASLAGIHVLLR